MQKKAFDYKKIDTIIKNTIDSVNQNKMEVFEIADVAKKYCKKLELEYEDIKRNIEFVSNEIKLIKFEFEKNKKLIDDMKNFPQKYMHDEIKDANIKEDAIKLKFSEKMQEQSNLLQRRMQTEVMLKESYETVKTAEGILENIKLSLVYLNGNLQDISTQMEGMTHKYHEGLKIISAQEEERQKVAKDIYSGPVSRIISAENEAIRCQGVINEDKEEAKKSMSVLKGLVRESVSDIRKIIYNLRPMSLDDLGLITTLNRYVENFEEETRISVTLNTLGLERDIKSIISLTAFRIVQETLENIKKHSGARDVRVLIEHREERLNIRVSDTGNGFDVEKLKEQDYYIKGGVGLFSINERLGLLGGSMDISSTKGKGTTVSISIPIIDGVS